MQLHTLLLLLFLMPALSACSSNDSSTGSGDQVCSPGERVMCTGDDGCSGYQECTSDGVRLSTCICDQSADQGGVGNQDASGGSSGTGDAQSGGEMSDGGQMANGGDMGVDGASPPSDMEMPAPAENLLTDPGFEEGAAAWNIWGGAARVEEGAQEGQWALRVTRGNGAEQRVDGLQPGATYRLSGWGRSEGAEPIIIGAKDYGGAQVQGVHSDAQYTQESITFTMGPNNTSATIFAYKHAEDAPAYADALSLTLDADAPQPEPQPDLELVWSDEFDGSGPLDPTKWTFEEGFQRNEELQWYQAENAFREDGVLVIEGRRESRPNPTHEPGSNDWRTRRPTIEYTSASVITAGLFDWQYGRLEVRAKVTNATGTWPAIWTLGVDCEWPSSGEVDVMENYDQKILANFAWGTDRRWNAQWDSTRRPVADFGAGWTDDFHVWALDWTEDRMTITLDGEVLNTVDLNTTINGSAACQGQNPFRQRHYLLLNLALGGAGGPVDNLVFPTRYLVDYVRVYQ